MKQSRGFVYFTVLEIVGVVILAVLAVQHLARSQKVEAAVKSPPAEVVKVVEKPKAPPVKSPEAPKAPIVPPAPEVRQIKLEILQPEPIKLRFDAGTGTVIPVTIGPESASVPVAPRTELPKPVRKHTAKAKTPPPSPAEVVEPVAPAKVEAPAPQPMPSPALEPVKVDPPSVPNPTAEPLPTKPVSYDVVPFFVRRTPVGDHAVISVEGMDGKLNLSSLGVKAKVGTPNSEKVKVEFETDKWYRAPDGKIYKNGGKPKPGLFRSSLDVPPEVLGEPTNESPGQPHTPIATGNEEKE